LNFLVSQTFLLALYPQLHHETGFRFV